MSEFSVQSEGLDVERIMEQVRTRIQANRDDDASDAPDREQADSKAAQLLDPGGARSALAGRPPHEKAAPAPSPSESFDFDEDTIYRSSRGAVGGVLYGIRKLLSPLLKFFFNIQPVSHALAVQSRINAQQAAFDDRVARLFDMSSSRLASREEIDKLNHRVMNDLVAEMTRVSVEMKNHRMLVESVAARLDFLDRQARAKESGAEPRTARKAADQPSEADGRTDGAEPVRRRRRRGRRRSGRATAATEAAGTEAAGGHRGGGRRRRRRDGGGHGGFDHTAGGGRNGFGHATRGGRDGLDHAGRGGRAAARRRQRASASRSRQRDGDGDRRRGTIRTTELCPRAREIAR